MKSTKLIIFGCNGFIGYNFFKYIYQHKLNNNFQILCVNSNKENKIYENIIYADINLNDLSSYTRLFKEYQPTHIINCIGKFKANFSELYDANVEISHKIIKGILEAKIFSRILLIGSAAEYGLPKSLPVTENSTLNPINLYGLSKVMQTQIFKYYFEKEAINMILARPFNLYGDGISKNLAPGNFLSKIEVNNHSKFIEVYNSESKRDYLHISKAVRYLYKALFFGRPGDIYNICSGKSISIFNIFTHILKKQNKKNISILRDQCTDNLLPDIYGSTDKFKEILSGKNM
jgi:GDP-4-dehydro-6-deoxy-D-mannose reductase